MTQSASKGRPPIQITRRGLVVWCLLIVFIAAWMFVLGILVGRGQAPLVLDVDRLQQELADLKAAQLQKEQTALEGQTGGGADRKTELGFYEALKSSQRPSAGSAAGRPAPAAPPLPNLVERLPIEITGRPPPSSAPPEVIKPKPAASPPPEVIKPPPAPAAPTPVAGGFTVQAGAFKDAPSAAQLVSRLRAKGLPAYQISTRAADRSVWYRVRVGAFRERAAAQAMLQKMQAAGIQGLVLGTP